MHLLLINSIGVWAAIISTLISYMAVSIYRYINIQKYILFRIKYYKFFIFIIFYIVSTIIYLYNNIYLNIVNLLFISLYSIINNKEYLKILKEKFKDNYLVH